MTSHAKAEKPSRDKLAWTYADELLRDDAYCGARGFDVRDIEEAYIGGYDEGFRAAEAGMRELGYSCDDETCCCGEPMKGHASPLICGHTPKSFAAWYVECGHKERDAALDRIALLERVAEAAKRYINQPGMSCYLTPMDREIESAIRMGALAMALDALDATKSTNSCDNYKLSTKNEGVTKSELSGNPGRLDAQKEAHRHQELSKVLDAQKGGENGN